MSAGAAAGAAVIVICAWCKRYLYGYGDSQDYISHGICPECAAKMIEDARQLLGEGEEKP